MATRSSAIIEVEHLTKRFQRAVRNPGLGGALQHLVRPRVKSVTAVEDICFSVEAGESVAYVGPNGAGKSTTVKLLTGILVPSAGTVNVCGLQPYRQRVDNARNISVVFGQRTQLWWDIAVEESFRLLGSIYEVAPADYRRSLADLDDVLHLGELMRVPARQLSLGQRMRCDLAAALIHAPQILYLDEPTIGLDVAVKARFRELIKRLHTEQGLTIMLTSHDLGDIEDLCPRMMMIDRGQIIYDGALSALKERFGWDKRLVVTLAGDTPGAETLVRQALGDRPVDVSAAADMIEIRYDNRTVRSGDLIRALPSDLSIAEIAVEETSIETIVRRLYEGELDIAAPDA